MNITQQMLAPARAAFEQGRHGEAEALCRAALACAPRQAEALYLLGRILHQAGRPAEAELWLRQAVEAEPESANAHYALGCACAALGNAAQAAACHAEAIRCNPAYVNAYYALGNACCQLREHERAAATYRQALALNPNDHEIWNNLAGALEVLRRVDEAIAAYDRAIALAPAFTLARSNRALLLLACGRFLEGFADYEFRLSLFTPRSYPQPLWRGEPIPGKTLFIYAEQGFGDVIQLARFAAPIRARGTRVILECQPPLRRLFELSQCADQVVAVGENPPAFDYFVPIMSLPFAMGLTLETIPSAPYLVAPAPAELPPSGAGHRRVGLVWAGSPTHRKDPLRSIPLADLSPLLSVSGAAFHSLQVGVRPGDAPVLASSSLVPLAGRFTDFYDTAAAVEAMDLVICVDTSVAHLAGALGKPVWTLLPHPADWRWLLQREDSPWYPSMRLFRQSQPGQWGPVIARVAAELERLEPKEDKAETKRGPG